MKSKIAITALIGVIASIVGLTACGGSDKPSQAAPAGNAVRISGFLFKPEKLSVEAGTTVTWTNADDIEHTVTSGTPDAATAVFDSGNKTKGQTFSHAFASVGTYMYFCKNHTGMRGEVVAT